MGKFFLFVAQIEFAGDELARVMGHPVGLLGFVDGQDGTAGSHGEGVGRAVAGGAVRELFAAGLAGEEVGIGAQVLRVDGGIIVNIHQQVALGMADAAVAGMGETLVGLDEVAELHVGVVGLEPLALVLGAVGAVVVDQHYFVQVARVVVECDALEDVVDVFVAIVCADDGGYHGILKLIV